MLQQEQAEDYIIATGIQHSVRDFVNAAAEELGMRLSWHGQGIDEVGALEQIHANREPRIIIRVDSRYFRPTEVQELRGDASKAREKLGWVPKTNFRELVSEMVREDLKSAERDELVKKHGFGVYDYHE